MVSKMQRDIQLLKAMRDEQKEEETKEVDQEDGNVGQQRVVKQNWQQTMTKQEKSELQGVIQESDRVREMRKEVLRRREENRRRRLDLIEDAKKRRRLD